MYQARYELRLPNGKRLHFPGRTRRTVTEALVDNYLGALRDNARGACRRYVYCHETCKHLFPEVTMTKTIDPYLLITAIKLAEKSKRGEKRG